MAVRLPKDKIEIEENEDKPKIIQYKEVAEKAIQAINYSIDNYCNKLSLEINDDRFNITISPELESASNSLIKNITKGHRGQKKKYVRGRRNLTSIFNDSFKTIYQDIVTKFKLYSFEKPSINDFFEINFMSINSVNDICSELLEIIRDLDKGNLQNDKNIEQLIIDIDFLCTIFISFHYSISEDNNNKYCQYCFRKINKHTNCQYHQYENRSEAIKIILLMNGKDYYFFTKYKGLQLLFDRNLKIYSKNDLSDITNQNDGIFTNEKISTLVEILHSDANWDSTLLQLKLFIQVNTPEIFLRLPDYIFNVSNFKEFVIELYSKNILDNSENKSYDPFIVIITILLADIWLKYEVELENKTDMKEIKKDIIKMKDEGIPRKDIMEKYNIKKSRYYDILNGK